METIAKLVPTTPPYRPNTTKLIQLSETQRKVPHKPLPNIHKYNTRAAKAYNEVKLPRVGQAKIVYKGAPININEVFTKKPGYKKNLRHQLPRV